MRGIIFFVVTSFFTIVVYGCSGLPQEQGSTTESVLVEASVFGADIEGKDDVVATNDTVPPAADQTKSKRETDSLVTVEDWQNFYHPRYLSGKFTASEHPGFKKVPANWTDGDGSYYLHEEAVTAFGKMREAALTDGVNLFIVSAFRNFARQKAIWEAKWNGNRLLEGKDNARQKYPDPAERARAILRYSSMPGTSRHHWGTDLDLNKLTNGYFASGEGREIYNWLLANAATYGFCQPYTAKGTERPNGYEEEKWHWSYQPISGPLTAYAAAHLDNAMIEGFDGAKSAVAIEVVENYVLGINQQCR